MTVRPVRYQIPQDRYCPPGFICYSFNKINDARARANAHLSAINGTLGRRFDTFCSTLSQCTHNIDAKTYRRPPTSHCRLTPKERQSHRPGKYHSCFSLLVAAIWPLWRNYGRNYLYYPGRLELEGGEGVNLFERHSSFERENAIA